MRTPDADPADREELLELARAGVLVSDSGADDELEAELLAQARVNAPVSFAEARAIVTASDPDLVVGRFGADTGEHWVLSTGVGADEDGEPVIVPIGGRVTAVVKSTGALVELDGLPNNPTALDWRPVYLEASGELTYPPDFLAELPPDPDLG